MEFASLFLVALAAGSIVRVMRFHRQLDRLATKIGTLRAAAARPLQYRAVARDEAAHAAKLAELDALAPELAAAGLDVLGDAIGANDPQPARWFADTERRVFGWVAVLRTASRVLRVAVVMSRAGEELFLTRLAPEIALAQPPFLRAESLGLGGTLPQLIAKHRERAGDPARLARIESLDAATGELVRLRERTIAWRGAEPPSELLDRDLRAILGPRHARLVPHLAKRLGIVIPRARVV